MYDVRGYQAGGLVTSGFPKFTGGWVTQTPSVGDALGDGGLELAVPTREGNLFVWKTGGSACGDLEWPKYQHDLHNSGDYDTDATAPGVLRNARLSGGTIQLIASGDNGYCAGTAKRYVLTVDGAQHVLPTAPAAAGTKQTLDASDLVAHAHSIALSVEDAAGNLSFPVTLLGHPDGPDPQATHSTSATSAQLSPDALVSASAPAVSSLQARLASALVDTDIAVLVALAALFARVTRRRVTR